MNNSGDDATEDHRKDIAWLTGWLTVVLVLVIAPGERRASKAAGKLGNLASEMRRGACSACLPWRRTGFSCTNNSKLEKLVEC
mmetsp:Transcript_9455/g.16672  ORF Transcript_9455/g.16672 Transcript_9455/m.16672 type:complete len:83 (+) Transcript_9455:237-485(+)